MLIHENKQFISVAFSKEQYSLADVISFKADMTGYIMQNGLSGLIDLDQYPAELEAYVLKVSVSPLDENTKELLLTRIKTYLKAS